MTLSDVKDWLWIAQLALTAIPAGLVLYMRGFFATKQELKEVTARTTTLEGKVEGLATKADVNQILVALERQDGDRKALSEKVSAANASITRLERPLDLIQEHLLRSTK